MGAQLCVCVLKPHLAMCTSTGGALRLVGCAVQDIEGRPSMVGGVNVLQQASMAAGSKVS